MSQQPDPSLGDIDAVLRFLPPSGSNAPVFAQAEDLTELVQVLYDHGWVSDFDWSEWQPVADRYARNPALLKDAGLGTLRKLFTTHVRRDQFCDGHLAEITRSGHLLALLRRLREIRGGLQL